MSYKFALFVFILGFAFTPFMAKAQQTKFVLSFSKPTNFIKGKSALKDGDLEVAITYLNKSIENGLSRDLKYLAHNHLCVAYYLKEDFKKALKNCNVAIKSASNKWEVYNNRGNIHLASGQYRLAILDYKKGLTLKKFSKMLQSNLEIAFVQQNKIHIPGKFIPARKKPNNFGRNRSTATAL